MKKLPLLLLLLIVVVLFSGCDEGAAYLASTSAAMCISKMRIIIGYAQDTGNRDDTEQISMAFSAWCWLPECIDQMNTIIGDNEELEELFATLRLVCGTCWSTSELPSYAPDEIVREIRAFCDNHTQYQHRRPEVIG